MTHSFNRRSFLAAAGALAAAALPAAHAAEKKREWPKMPDVPTDFNPERCFVELAEKGEGVVFEGPKGAPVVRIVFDPQCQWCVWEYNQLKPFLGKVTFIWHPVAVLNPNSEPQGAAILSAADPKAKFLEHEAHFRDEKFKGLDIRGQEFPWEKRVKVWENSKAFRRAAGNSVPFGAIQMPDGRYIAMPQSTTAEFAKLTGVKY
ncbi:hypothetical protein [Sutterella sp.]|uniref:hypothetical protein n=1 Tax=Sutterella sp. TaxID=1981025 RepID=UPI0026E05424|nr:hypothetical protein [Sutterella sp.]MDO5532373.1 hypothetical protein [Sutterella sp.]